MIKRFLMIDEGRNSLAILLFIAIGLQQLLLIFLIPPFQAPDEPTHLEHILLRMRSPFDLPVGAYEETLQRRLIYTMEQYGFTQYLCTTSPIAWGRTFQNNTMLASSPSKTDQPPLFYILGAFILMLLGDLSMVGKLIALRIFNSLLYMLNLWVIFQILRIVWNKNRPLQVLALSFIGFLPQFSLIGASVNSDNLLNLLSSLVILLIIRQVIEGYGASYLTATILALFAAMLTKRTGFILMPILFFGLWFIYMKAPMKRRPNWILIITSISFVFIVSLALVQMDERTYDGMSRFLCGIGNIFNLSKDFFSQYKCALWNYFLKGFLLKPGWMSFEPVAAVYFLFYLMVFIAIIGLILFMFNVKARKRFNELSLIFAFLLFCFFTALFVVLMRGFSNDNVLQGRYLYPVISICSILIITGLSFIGGRKYHLLAPGVFVLIILSIQAYSIFILQAPWYYLERYPVKKVDELDKMLRQSGDKRHQLIRYHIDAGSLNSRDLIVSGLYPPQQAKGFKYSWSYLQTLLVLPLRGDADYNFSFRCYPLPARVAMHEPSIDLLVNGKYLETVRLARAWRTYTVRIPAIYIKDGINFIYLHENNLFVPRNEGISNDTRALSIAYDCFEISQILKDANGGSLHYNINFDDLHNRSWDSHLISPFSKARIIFQNIFKWHGNEYAQLLSLISLMYLFSISAIVLLGWHLLFDL